MGSGYADITPADDQQSVGEVELAVPADASYVALLRTVTASMAARRDFTLEEIDDLRLAVDEASALLLPQARDGDRLAVLFGGGDELTLRIDVALVFAEGAGGAVEVDDRNFAWMVLAALADSVSTFRLSDRLVVSLVKSRSARV